MKFLQKQNLPLFITIILCIFPIRFLHGQPIAELSETLLKDHPEIRALDSELKSKKSDGDHKTTYPDPKIGFAYRNYPYSRDGRFIDSKPNTPTMTGIEYSISQEIPFPGKLTMEGKIGKLAALEFEHFSKLQKNKFLKEFYLLLLRLHLTENKIAWNKSASEIISSIEKISKANYSAGKNPYVQVLKNKINLTMTKDKGIELALTKDSLKSSIKYFSDPVQIDFDKIHKNDIIKFLNSKKDEMASDDFKKLENQLVKNPNLLLSETTLQKNKQEEKLAKLSHLPETEVFFSYMKRRDQKFALDSGPLDYKIMDSTEFRGDLMSFGLTMRVPVWSMLTKSHLSDREEERVKAGSSENQKRFIELETVFKNAITLYNGADNQLKLHDEFLIPQLKQAQIAQSAVYQNRKSDLSETLELKLEFYNSHFVREDLLEKKYTSLLTILELTDLLLPRKNQVMPELNGDKK